MISNFITNISIIFIKLISKLPFRIIYIFSDILYFAVYYIFRYRRSIVLTNLRNSFPEKDEVEIKAISKKFYRHFSDMTFESLKMNGMSKKDYSKRVVIKNLEEINSLYDRGKSVVVLTMHYNNWEWGNYVSTYIKHKPLGVYRPLSNKKFDKFMLTVRKKQGTKMVKDSKIFRQVIKYDKKNEKVFIWMAADHTPPPTTKFWTIFLNQETPFYSGPEKIASHFNYPVFFQHIRKIKRGKYEMDFIQLIENTSAVKPNDIMLLYIKKMEEIIQNTPEYYLWSHRRWKHKRPENIQLQ